MNNKLQSIAKKTVTKILATVMTVSTIASGIAVSAPETVKAATSVSGVSTVSNMTNDFAKGVDISEVIALEKGGASYKYLDGTSADIFDILKGAGVNYVRIRIWNNPYDSSASTNYKGYGAGNTDLYNAKVLGKRATDAGMKVYIDFHYSDFWADPEKQFAPKEWKDYSLAYKKDAVYNFTYNSMKELLDYGLNIGMVQIGNETNGSMCGVGGLYDNVWDLSSGVAALMQQGCYAIDDINSAYGKSILKCLHFTDLNTLGEWYAKCLANQGVDYDVFATSYYPMWHGTVADLQSTLTSIAKTYNKKVMVAEVAYPYTFDNADSEGNNVSSKAYMNCAEFDVSVSGQAQALRGVFNAVAAVNKTVPGAGIGAFYWAPEWIAVNSSTWGTNGSGWASSVTGNYEKLYSNSVTFYSTTDRGSSWDNMTLFDKNGVAMKSLYVFNDISGTASTTGTGAAQTTTLDGTYYIKSAYSGLYLDVAGRSSANNANIQQYAFNGGTNQKFKLVSNSEGYYNIYTGSSNYTKVVDVAGRSTANNANILQYSYSGGTNQQFEIVEISSGVYAIKTRVSGSKSCLDVYGWSTANGGNIAQYSYWGGQCQLWILEKAN